MVEEQVNGSSPKESIIEILTKYYHHTSPTESVSLTMTKNDSTTKYLKLQMSQMFLDQDEYRVATFIDETESKTLAQVEQQNSLLSLFHSSVSHEMVTPLKCIISFAKTLEKELTFSPRHKDAQMIQLTANLLLSEVKMSLDRSLLENNRFVPDYTNCPINRVVADVIDIMRAQADLKQIQLVFQPAITEKIWLRIDLQRTQ